MCGIQVTSLGRTLPPYRNSELLKEIGVQYVSNQEISLPDAVQQFGPFDIMFEATGYAPMVFEAMEHLGKNGVLILSSVTGGRRNLQVPADMINLGFVLGNKVMVGTVNAYRAGVALKGYDPVAYFTGEHPIQRLPVFPLTILAQPFNFLR